MINRYCVALGVFLLAFVGTGPAGASPYFTDIGTLPGDANSEAMGINNNGQVVGTSWAGVIGSSNNTAWIYNSGTIQAVSGSSCYGYGINSSGVAVGFTENTGANPPNPVEAGTVYSYSGSSWTTTVLSEPSQVDPNPPYDLYGSGEAYAISGNLAGGKVLNGDPGGPAALIWNITTPTSYTDLRSALVSTFGAGTGGQTVVGLNSNFAFVEYADGVHMKAAVYNLNTSSFVTAAVPGLGGTDIFPGGGAAGGLDAGGTGISDNFDSAGNGWVVGSSSDPTAGSNVRAYAATLNGTTWTTVRLGGLDPGPGVYNQSRALAVNATGQVVGYSYAGTAGGQSGAQDAFYYDAANGMKDLNTYFASVLGADGWSTLTEATSINGSGQIVGYGTTTSGATHGFELQLLPGDANLDGKVDINDLTIVLSHYGDSSGVSWGSGDLNHDGKVDINDLTIVLAHYGQTLGASAPGISAVPEPGAIALLAAGIAGLLACASRKRK